MRIELLILILRITRTAPFLLIPVLRFQTLCLNAEAQYKSDECNATKDAPSKRLSLWLHTYRKGKESSRYEWSDCPAAC